MTRPWDKEKITMKKHLFYSTFTLHWNETKTGTGTKMESIVPCRNAHTGLRQEQGPGSIVSYCTSPILCTGPSPSSRAV